MTTLTTCEVCEQPRFVPPSDHFCHGKRTRPQRTCLCRECGRIASVLLPAAMWACPTCTLIQYVEETH
jgi:hypothetical protein